MPLSTTKYPIDCVVVKLPTFYHGNYGLEMHSDRQELVAQFKQLVFSEMTCCYFNDPEYEEKHSWGTFHQGTDNSTWEYFELWHEQTLEFQDKLLAKAFSIAERLGCPVEVW